MRNDLLGDMREGRKIFEERDTEKKALAAGYSTTQRVGFIERNGLTVAASHKQRKSRNAAGHEGGCTRCASDAERPCVSLPSETKKREEIVSKKRGHKEQTLRSKDSVLRSITVR